MSFQKGEMAIGLGIVGHDLVMSLLAVLLTLRVGREAGTFSLPLLFFKGRGYSFLSHMWCTFVVANFILLKGSFSSFLWRSSCSEMRCTAMHTKVFPCCK